MCLNRQSLILYQNKNNFTLTVGEIAPARQEEGDGTVRVTSTFIEPKEIVTASMVWNECLSSALPSELR